MHALGGTNTIFGRGNITIYPATTSEEILNIHGKQRADLIITEDSLPLMGAARLCAIIRGDALLKKVSIVVICNVSKGSLVRWREAGANDVISRPVDAAELFSKISELLVIPQRKDLRVSMQASVKSQNKKGSFPADSRNISIAGMLLETDQIFQNGDRLDCAFKIGHSEIVVECMVTRTDAGSTGKRRYGVKFLNFDTKALIIIDQFIKLQAKR